MFTTGLIYIGCSSIIHLNDPLPCRTSGMKDVTVSGSAIVPVYMCLFLFLFLFLYLSAFFPVPLFSCFCFFSCSRIPVLFSFILLFRFLLLFIFLFLYTFLFLFRFLFRFFSCPRTCSASFPVPVVSPCCSCFLSCPNVLGYLYFNTWIQSANGDHALPVLKPYT